MSREIRRNTKERNDAIDPQHLRCVHGGRANVGQTWLQETEPGHSLSSLTLVAFDATSGQMRHIGDWQMDGILPEGVAFDAAGKWVVAGVFEYVGPEPRKSALEFWRVHRVPGEDPALVPSLYHVETGPGAHSLIVVDD